jgi:uroporphyrinogen-III synthase
LRAVGVPDVTIPQTTYDSEGLLALPALASLTGKRIAIFKGEGGRDHLADALRARGAQVECVDCYRRIRPESGADGLAEALLQGRAHALTITSSEGLDNLRALLDGEAVQRLRALPTFVPHPRIEENARAHGFHAVLTDSGDAGLIAGLLHYFSRDRRT